MSSVRVNSNGQCKGCVCVVFLCGFYLCLHVCDWNKNKCIQKFPLCAFALKSCATDTDPCFFQHWGHELNSKVCHPPRNLTKANCTEKNNPVLKLNRLNPKPGKKSKSVFWRHDKVSIIATFSFLCLCHETQQKLKGILNNFISC